MLGPINYFLSRSISTHVLEIAVTHFEKQIVFPEATLFILSLQTILRSFSFV